LFLPPQFHRSLFLPSLLFLFLSFLLHIFP
jgi:hypothetical protein